MPALLAFAILLAAPRPLQARSVLLSGDLAPLPGSIRSAKSTPDGRTVLFLDAQGRLLATDANSGLDVLLATPAEHGGIAEFQIDAQGEHVRRSAGSRQDLVSFSLAGGGTEVVLTPIEQNVNRFLRTHDGAQVVFDARISSTGTELFAVAPDGSSAPARLSPSETEHSGRVDSFGVAGDRVAFTIGGTGLFTASLAPDTWIRLDRSTPAEGYALSPDGRTLYVVDDYAPGGKHELWRRATDGGAPERLNPSMPNQSGVKVWRLASDARSIVYAADLVTVGHGARALTAKMASVGAKVAFERPPRA